MLGNPKRGAGHFDLKKLIYKRGMDYMYYYEAKYSKKNNNTYWVI